MKWIEEALSPDGYSELKIAVEAELAFPCPAIGSNMMFLLHEVDK